MHQRVIIKNTKKYDKTKLIFNKNKRKKKAEMKP